MDENVLDAGAIDPFDGSENLNQNEGSDNNLPPSDPGNSSDDNEFISDLLYLNGISDPSKIKFEEDNGNIIERSWKDLTREEKLNIANSRSNSYEDYTNENSSLTPSELDLITHIRETQLTPEEFLESLREEASQNTYQNESYEVDSIPNDELFLLDALSKYGEENVTDEQLEELLNNAKADPDLYEKTITNLRLEYKQKEDELKYEEQQKLENQEAQEFENFRSSVLDEIESFNGIGNQNIELSVEDMNDMANFILEKNLDGNSDFGKMLSDPKQFVELAFWALKGNDIMQEMSSQIQKAYAQGVAAGKRGQSQLAFGNLKDKYKPQNNHTSAAALDVDDYLK
jgi:hypothetical protein